jgi:hypothetical protein
MTRLPELPPLHEVTAHYDALARRAARPLETIPSPPPCFECHGDGRDPHDRGEPCWACMDGRYVPGTTTRTR